MTNPQVTNPQDLDKLRALADQQTRVNLAGALYQNPDFILSLLERTSSAQWVLSTLNSSEAPFSVANALLPPGNVLSNVDEVQITPPVDHVGLALSCFANVNTISCRFDIFKDDKNIVSLTTPLGRVIDPLPDLWLPFYHNLTYRFTNNNAISAAASSSAELNIVFVPNELWGSIERLFYQIADPINAAYNAARGGHTVGRI